MREKDGPSHLATSQSDLKVHVVFYLREHQVWKERKGAGISVEVEFRFSARNAGLSKSVPLFLALIV